MNTSLISRFVKLLVISFVMIYNKSLAQIDKTFWFAVPEVTERHADQPIYLRIATLSNPSDVTISVPAAGVTIASNVSIAANSTYSIDLTSYKGLLEQGENNINTPLNKGLLITATDYITAYYEVLGSVDYGKPTQRIVNTDIFSLKGSNALGTEFYVPFQNIHQNVVTDFWGTDIRGKSTIDIVATEDSTIIDVFPTQPYRVGTSSSIVPLHIKLDKGQTYSIEAYGSLGPEHMTGTHIVSDKPIAVTMKDDSIIEAGKKGYDLAGDQIIPIIRVGKEYIVYQGFAFITAIKDNTVIALNGVPVATINKGQTYSSDLRTQTSAMYITTSEPAYMHHLIEMDGEMASAVMPPLKCTGSQDVTVNRSSFNYGEVFYLLITVRSGSEGDFIVKNSLYPSGTNTIIKASDFSVVPGTSGNWLFTILAFNDLSKIPMDGNTIINTTGIFHLGIINGKSTTPGAPNPLDVNPTGYRYGYFTDFGNLNVSVNIPDECIKEGDSIFIYPGSFQTYLWSTGSVDSAIYIKKSGGYNLTVTNGEGCVGTESFSVDISLIPRFTLGPDQVFCASGSVDLAPLKNNFDNLKGLVYEWSNGSNASSISTTDNGVFTLKVTNNCAYSSDTVVIDHVEIHTHNLFTPNGDGKNETFKLSGLEKIGSWELNVYDRWGGRVFKSDKYDNTWDGNNSADGVYYYKFIDKTNVCPEFNGWVEIVR